MRRDHRGAKTARIRATTTPNDQPPVTTDPAPGDVDQHGAHETDPFMVVQTDTTTSSRRVRGSISRRVRGSISRRVRGSAPISPCARHRSRAVGARVRCLACLAAWPSRWAWRPRPAIRTTRALLHHAAAASPRPRCASHAVAPDHRPYVAQPAPIVCQTSLASIDPRTFVSAKRIPPLVHENAVSQTAYTRIYSSP